jgi:hypothetical protein
LQDKGIYQFAVITSDFHMPRAKKIFETLFDSTYKIEWSEDHPKLTNQEIHDEQRVENFMTTHLAEHLKYYTLWKINFFKVILKFLHLFFEIVSILFMLFKIFVIFESFFFYSNFLMFFQVFDIFDVFQIVQNFLVEFQIK